MSPEAFLANFGHVANAPGGIAQLRDLVLSLAFQGNLSERQANESVERLLNSLEQSNNASAGAPAKRGRKTIAGNESLRAFDLNCPDEWAILPLGRIGPIFNGDSINKREKESRYRIKEGRPFIATKDVGYGRDPLDYENGIRIPLEEKKYKIARLGAVLICAEGGSAGRKCGITEQDICFGNKLFALEPYGEIPSRFILYWYQSPIFQQLFRESMTGIIGGISRNKFINLPIPLPPIAEQKRIVAKVDTLMALCDRLEEQQRKRAEMRPISATASHTRFTENPTPETLLACFAEPGHANPKELRRTILSMAVQGKLLAQDDRDEHAEELLKRVENNLEKRKKRHNKAHASEIIPPYELPVGWVWAKFPQLGEFGRGKSKHRPRNDPSLYSNGVYPLVQTGDVSRAHGLITTHTGKYNEKGLAQSKLWPEETLCITIAANIAESGILGFEACFPDSVVGFVRAKELPTTKYFEYFMRTAKERIEVFAPATAQKNINLGILEQVSIPLPPANEQRRIVAKVDELMALVDKLEQQQTRREELATAFAQSAVSALTGTEFKPKPDKMKAPYTEAAPLMRSYPKQPGFPYKGFVLKEIMLLTAYRSLAETDLEFHYNVHTPDEAAPICLVGLNGSGKSNLIEAIADIFCYLELINLPWESIANKYHSNDHKFELKYTLQEEASPKRVKIVKRKKKAAEFFIISEEGKEKIVTDPLERIGLLPRRIVGYSSGLNETLSHPFLRTRTMYSEEVQKAAPPNGIITEGINPVFNTRSLYMDYENNAEILICNFIFGATKELSFIKDFTRVESVSRFSLSFRRKIAGKSGDAAIARLTNELKDYLRRFALCAGKDVDVETQEPQRFDYILDKKTKNAFKKQFESAEKLFMAMYKWSLLNALVLSKEQRNVFLKEDITKGTLERPPVVPPKERLFDVSNVKVTLSQPKIEIDYSGLSDGEHQFVQVFGTILLFNEPGTLFLLDEPESHFNPEWRTKFNSILNKLPNSKAHEYIISTHSPYIVSGSRQENVYKFERSGATVSCKTVDYETYGASFDLLLNKLFSINSLIDKSARDELEKVLKSGGLEKLEAAVGDFAESDEKRRLYEAILREREKA